ncbi:hypothetical protein IFM89_004055 [Coptis chinensis]|uniref:Lipoxygenase domain-containing protein n=1 Tax=Coptis chinensis TaxID=261450 RepID=A0A835LE82_9MAGN|nr:hypothetical protein IFM89_004055 [Coptis chinensis]
MGSTIPSFEVLNNANRFEDFELMLHNTEIQVALSYNLLILDDGVILVTPSDVLVDALGVVRHSTDEVWQRDTPEWTSDAEPKEAFKQFRDMLVEIENRNEELNKNML